MAEDSGAFKTNLRICAGFRHNIMIRDVKKQNRRPLKPSIFNNRARGVVGILQPA
jgi:hypothetical protein